MLAAKHCNKFFCFLICTWHIYQVFFNHNIQSTPPTSIVSPYIYLTEIKTSVLVNIHIYLWRLPDKIREGLVALSCQFYRLEEVAFNLSIHRNQACCNLSFANLLQLVETTCSKLVANRFWQSTCNTSVDNLHQTCRQQAVASHVSES